METFIGIMPLLSLLFFVGIFTLVVLYVVTDRRRQHNARMAAKPLDDGLPAEKERDRG